MRELAKLPDPVGMGTKPLPARKEGRPARADQMAGQDLRVWLYSKLGADLTAIEGIGSMKARLGAAEAVTATAHKLARLIYRLLKHGEAYVRQGMADYEKKFQERKLYALRKSAKAMGFQLIANTEVTQPVS